MTLSDFLRASGEAASPSSSGSLRRLLALPPLVAAPLADFRLAALACLGFFALLLPGLPSLMADPDMFWHIRTGQDILANGHVPTTDSYSWTMQGQPWIAKEWLSQALYALAYASGGWTGAALLATAA
jgi:hypothetical protein